MKLQTTWVVTVLSMALAAAPVRAASGDDTGAPNDLDITDVVVREILYDRAIPAHAIDVFTSNGIVELEGRVDNLLAKDRAARTAATVKGVRSVVNEIVVRPTPGRTDAEIAEEIESALLFDPATEAYEIDVAVVAGHVTLTGQVESWAERDLAATVAKGVKGVTGLENEITLETITDRSDDEIRADIRRTLEWNLLVDDELIDVTVEDGHVILGGIVGSFAEKANARRLCWTAGVRSVDADAVQVEPWAKDEGLRAVENPVRSDQEIRLAVESAFAHDPRLEAAAIEAASFNGIVTLRGTVDSLKARRVAEQTARLTTGVFAVDNLLRVRPDPERSDDQVTSAVLAALIRDPYVNSFELDVTTYNGIVTLEGAVDTYFEKAQADDVASKVRGVLAVVNRIDVVDTPYAYDPHVDDWNIYAMDWYRTTPTLSETADAEIRAAIERELFWSPFVDADQVQVEVDDGVATLTGRVDSWSEWTAARSNAYEGGATFVRNDLRLRTGE